MTDAQFDLPLNQEQPMPEQPQEQTGETDIVGMPLDQIIDTEIADMVNGCYESSKQWREPFKLSWDEEVDNYEQVYDATGKEAWQATTFQPMTTTHVERSTANLHNMSMGPEVPVEYQPRNPENEEQVSHTNEIIQHDLEKMKFKVHWTDFLRTVSLHGTAIGKVDYVKEKTTVMVKERQRPLFGGMFSNMGAMFGFGQAEETGDKFTPQEMLTKDHATFKNKDIYKIYPQPYIEDFSKDSWVIEEFDITNKELVEGAMNEDPYYRLDNVTQDLLMSGAASPMQDEQTQSKRMAMQDHDVPMPYLEPGLKHKGKEYWGPVPRWYLEPDTRLDPIKKYETVNAWIWVIDGRWVVRKRLTPFIDACPPYVKGNYIRRPGQFYGIGNGRLLAGLQVEKNEIRNTRQDNINLMLNKIVAVLKDKIPKSEQDKWISEPGAKWLISGIDDIRKALFPVEFPDITPDSWRASGEVDREAQEATDVIKSTQTMGGGEDQAGNGTFRGQLMNKQTANERFMLYARILEIMGLNAAISKIYERIYQFKSYKQIDKILGEKGKGFQLIPCEEMNEIASLISLGSLTNENKGVKLAQMREWFMLFGQEPWVKKVDYARKMYRLGGMGSDPDEVMFTDEELQIFNQARAKMINSTGMPGDALTGGPGMGPASSPIAGDTPPPMDGMPRPPMGARGPGASPADMAGMPMS